MRENIHYSATEAGCTYATTGSTDEEQTGSGLRQLFLRGQLCRLSQTDVECDVDTFQAIARVTKSKIPSVTCRPCFIDMQSPPGDIDEAEIIFRSFSDLASVIGITSITYLVTMAIRERSTSTSTNTGGRERINPDVAVRVLGTCVLHEDDERTPAVLMICHSINEDHLTYCVDVFIWNSREFDFAGRTYMHPLQHQKITGSSFLRRFFAPILADMNNVQQLDCMKDICQRLRHFALRWHPITTPNARLWTRSLVLSDVMNGILEIELPFLILRGPEIIQELKQLQLVVTVVMTELERQLKLDDHEA